MIPMSCRKCVAILAILSACLVLLAGRVVADAFGAGPRASFVGSRSYYGKLNEELVVLRGGATLQEEDEIEIESSDDEEEEEDSDEEEELDPKLAKAAQTAVSKTKSKATAAVKETVSSTLLAAAVKPKKKKSSLLKLPYIVKALFNPLVLIKMTQGYWASLFNLKYLDDKVDTSADLRSALEQKAKKGGPSGGARGKRKMKPGQAKTLSDLPQLNT